MSNEFGGWYTSTGRDLSGCIPLGFLILIVGVILVECIVTDGYSSQTGQEVATAVAEENASIPWGMDDWVVVPDGYQVSWYTYNTWAAQPIGNDDCSNFYAVLSRLHVDDTWIEAHRPDGFCSSDVPPALRQCIIVSEEHYPEKSVYCGGRSAWVFSDESVIPEAQLRGLYDLFAQKTLTTP
jgi:hypothetical protein